jgi:hypothetical protein
LTSYLTLPALKVSYCRVGLGSNFIPLYPRRGRLVCLGRLEIQRTCNLMCGRGHSGPRKRGRLSSCQDYGSSTSQPFGRRMPASTAAAVVVTCPQYILVSLQESHRQIQGARALDPIYRDTTAATTGLAKIQPRACGVQRRRSLFLPFFFFARVSGAEGGVVKS